MKTKKYIINTYKGNLLESVKRFQNAHEGVKIFEAVEKDGKLEITAEAQEDNVAIDEASGFNINKVKKCLAAGGEKLRKALDKLSDALGSHGDIHGAIDSDEFTDEEYDIISDFFEEVLPQALQYRWKPYDDGSSDFTESFSLM